MNRSLNKFGFVIKNMYLIRMYIFMNLKILNDNIIFFLNSVLTKGKEFFFFIFMSYTYMYVHAGIFCKCKLNDLNIYESLADLKAT